MPAGLAAVPSGPSLIAIREDPDTGCWIWLGEIDKKGYGRFSIGGRRVQAHIYLWTEKNGPLPPSIQLDHMCRRRACVRPEHMDPVSGSENVKRTFARYRRALEYCPALHRLDETGKATPEGGVVCKLCSGVT